MKAKHTFLCRTTSLPNRPFYDSLAAAVLQFLLRRWKNFGWKSSTSNQKFIIWRRGVALALLVVNALHFLLVRGKNVQDFRRQTKSSSCFGALKGQPVCGGSKSSWKSLAQHLVGQQRPSDGLGNLGNIEKNHVRLFLTYNRGILMTPSSDSSRTEAMAADCLRMEKRCEDLQEKNDALHARLEQKTKLVEQAWGAKTETQSSELEKTWKNKRNFLRIPRNKRKIVDETSDLYHITSSWRGGRVDEWNRQRSRFGHRPWTCWSMVSFPLLHKQPVSWIFARLFKPVEWLNLLMSGPLSALEWCPTLPSLCPTVPVALWVCWMFEPRFPLKIAGRNSLRPASIQSSLAQREVYSVLMSYCTDCQCLLIDCTEQDASRYKYFMILA